MHINFFFRNPECYTSGRLLVEAASAGLTCSSYDPMKVSIIDERPVFSGRELEKCEIAFFRGSVDDLPRHQIVSLASWYMNNSVCTINFPQAIMICADKWATHQTLRQGGVQTPKAALVMERTALESSAHYCGGFPLLVKFLYGSGGVGVVMVRDMMSLISLYDAYTVLNVSFMLEEYIPEAMEGVQRVVAFSENILASFIMFPAADDFRSNFSKGGGGRTGPQAELADSEALKALKLCGLKVGSVDVVMRDGKAFVIEVNSAPGIELAEKVTGNNIAGKMIEKIAQDYERQICG